MAFDLSQFFGPITGNGGAGASGAVSGASGGVDADRLDYTTPQPHDDPDTWDTVWVAEMPLPPVGTGAAKIKLSPEVKLDAKAKAGASASRVTKTGGAPTKGSITVKFVSEALPAMEKTISSLYPGNGPFPVKHPKARWGRLTHLIVEKWDDAPDPDAYGVFTWTLQYMGIVMDAQTGAGSGTLTAPAIQAQIIALEKRRAEILAIFAKDPTKQSDFKLVAEIGSIETKRTALEEQLNKLATPDGAVSTPKQSAGTAKPGDVVNGKGTIAGAQNAAAASRAQAQSAAAQGAKP